MKREQTAKEFMDELEKDPEYRARTAEKERQWAQFTEMLRKDEEPLVRALTAAGWPENVRQCDDTRSVWDLVNTAVSYPHLLAVLADHITRPYHFRTKEGIARALTVREARGTPVPRVLLEELKKEAEPKDVHESSYRWCLINALVLIGDSSMTEDVRQLMKDPRYAPVRRDLQRLARALCRPGRRTPRT